MKLYMVRHGQSESNLAKCFSGWAQISLTEQGFEDARRAGEYLQRLTFDRIYASDLKRAIQTAQTALPGCQPILDPLLRENNVGRLQGLSVAECEAQYGKGFWHTPTGADFKPFGGEDHDMLRQRMRTFLTRLEQDPCEQAIAFAHEGALRCTLDLVLGMGFNRRNVRCPNCTIAIFTWLDDHWVLEAWNAGA